MELSEFTIEELKYVLKHPKDAKEKVVEKAVISIYFDPNSERIQSLYDIDPAIVLEEFRSREKAIYGIDERIEVLDTVDQSILDCSESVCAIIHYSSISDYGNGNSRIHGDTYEKSYNLCPSERFLNQPVSAIGTGFLVDYSIIVTAAHCIDENSIREHKFVFGFETVSDGSARIVIPNSDIYQGLKILDRRFEKSQGIDWAVIQLDRPVLDKAILKFNFSDQVNVGENVFCIGHPCGLPKKIALNGIVQEDHANYFIANIDTYGGNSGSPVINNSTKLVEGLLVRGATDFIPQGLCNISHRCMASNCNGEEIFKPKDFHFLIPSLSRPGFDFDYKAIYEDNSNLILGIDRYLNFTGKEDKIKKAIETIQFYGFNFYGTIYCDSNKMGYYLCDGKAPQGDLPTGEDQISFNRNKIEVRRIGSRWKLLEENHWILDFNERQDEARQALSIILQYQFNSICFVGRPRAPLVYFKK